MQSLRAKVARALFQFLFFTLIGVFSCASAHGQDDPKPLTPERRNLIRLLTKQAWENMERGFVPLAEKSFQAVLDEDPTNTDAKIGLGIAKFQLGMTTEGLDLLHEAWQQDPTNPRWDNWLERVYASLLDQGKQEVALQYLDKLRQHRADQTVLELMDKIIGAIVANRGTRRLAFEYLQQARRESPYDPWVNFWIARIYLNRRWPVHAVNALGRVEAVDPYYPNLYVFLGSAYLQDRQYLTAVRLFSSSRPTTPELRQSTLLQAGSALASLGLRGSAYGNFYSVRRQSESGSEIHRQAGRLIGQLNNAVAENRWSGFLKYSQQHDDNPAVLPEVNVFGVGAPAREANHGSLINMRINHQIIGDADYDLTAGYTYYQTLNYEQHMDVDVWDHQWDLTYNYRWTGVCNLYQASLSTSYDYLSFGYKPLLNRGIVTAGLTIIDSDFTNWSGYFRYSAFDFLGQLAATGTPRDLDADNIAIGISRSRRIASTDLTFQFGYQFDQNDADGRDFDYLGHRISCGVVWAPQSCGLTMSLIPNVYFRTYDQPDSIFGILRDDEEYFVTANISYELNDDASVFVEYNLDRNDSTLPINDYERNIIGAGILLQFK